jgi:hypothetical protein
MMVANEVRIVNDLHEEVMDQLRAEPVGVQIKLAFGVLLAVLNHGMRRRNEARCGSAAADFQFTAVTTLARYRALRWFADLHGLSAQAQRPAVPGP